MVSSYSFYEQDQANAMYVSIFSDDGSVAPLQDFDELKNQYAVLQHKTSATGLTKETLGKVKQLKDAAAKLAGDTEDKIRRIAGISSFLQLY